MSENTTHIDFNTQLSLSDFPHTTEKGLIKATIPNLNVLLQHSLVIYDDNTVTVCGVTLQLERHQLALKRQYAGNDDHKQYRLILKSLCAEIGINESILQLLPGVDFTQFEAPKND